MKMVNPKRLSKIQGKLPVLEMQYYQPPNPSNLKCNMIDIRYYIYKAISPS
jgi:hypothetical protein